MARTYRPFHGVLLLDKPLHLSSNTALQQGRRLVQAEKAGHTGTLDPLASGLLPLCFGEATKFSTALLDADKSYRTTVRLGITTATGDVEGEVIAEQAVPPLTLDEVEAVLARFRGPIVQVPPMYSALKHQGKPLYEYVRKGETVERAGREVVIHDLQLLGFDGVNLELDVRCSKGTYIRTLGEDIGLALGCGAHLTALRRTRIAHFDLNTAYTLDALTDMDMSQREACVLPVDCLLPEVPKLTLDDTAARRLALGQRLGMDTGLPDGRVALYNAQGFIGTGQILGRRLAPERLLGEFCRAEARGNSLSAE